MEWEVTIRDLESVRVFRVGAPDADRAGGIAIDNCIRPGRPLVTRASSGTELNIVDGDFVEITNIG